MRLIDTSAWIHWLRQDGDVGIGDAVDHALRAGEAAWCGMVRLELWNGARGNAEQKALRQLEAVLPELGISAAVWEEAHACARRARLSGVTAPATDLVIFACARHYDLDLLHSDADFTRLEQALR